MSQVITIDDLTSYMPTSTLDDGLTQQIVDGINSWIETSTNRCFGETKQVAERHDWGRMVWLNHMDVQSIEAVSTGWPQQTAVTVPSTGYFWNPYGRLEFFGLYGAMVGRNIRDYLLVEYTYGVVDVPDDLKMACLGVAAGFYAWASNGNRDVASVSVGSYHIEYTNKRTTAGSVPDPATSTADANWAVIESYKLRRQ
jgi:hypothetical protein